jgi:hypothetical protein
LRGTASAWVWRYQHRDLFRRIEADTNTRDQQSVRTNRASRDQLNNLITAFAVSVTNWNQRLLVSQVNQVRAAFDRRISSMVFFNNGLMELPKVIGSSAWRSGPAGPSIQSERQWNANGSTGNTGNSDYSLNNGQMRQLFSA